MPGPDVVLSVGSALVAVASSLGGGSSSRSAAEKFSRGWYIKLGLCIVAWFASSAICSFGTKRSLTSLAPYSCAGTLTTLQFVIAAAVGGATYLATGERMVPGIKFDVFRVAMAYTFGFLFFNMSYGRLAASFAETVRGMEPLFAFTLARLLGARGGTLSSTSVTALACLLLGGTVSCYAQQFDAVGLVLAVAANTCFAGRSILVSQLQDKLRRRPPPLAPSDARDAGDRSGGVGGGGGAIATAAARPELSVTGMFFYQHALGLVLMARDATLRSGVAGCCVAGWLGGLEAWGVGLLCSRDALGRRHRRRLHTRTRSHTSRTHAPTHTHAGAGRAVRGLALRGARGVAGDGALCRHVVARLLRVQQHGQTAVLARTQLATISCI